MANYNFGAIYNTKGNEGGFFYNGVSYFILLNLQETVSTKEDFTKYFVSIILSEKSLNSVDFISLFSLYNQPEQFSFSEESKISVLFNLLENANIKDGFIKLIVLAFLKDQFSFLEKVNSLAEILSSENINLEEIVDLESFFNLLEQYNLTEIEMTYFVYLMLNDRLGMTDREPKTAVSDFIVGISDGLDNAYDWLIPFGLKIDWSSSTIQVMPETEITAVEMPGIDGSIVEDTVYKDRLFQIVGFSEQGLTREQKEELKSNIAEVLNATKYQEKKLTIQSRGTSFDVRYDGQANITEGPSYVKATIPFRAQPYGYESFENELQGIGLIDNYGVAPLGVVFNISGPISNPSFTLETYSYSWNGTVPSGKTLVIDQNMLTCYLVDDFGNKENAMKNFNGKFYKIPAGQSAVLNADDETAAKMITQWKIKVLW